MTDTSDEQPRPAFDYITTFMKRNNLSKEQFADRARLPLSRMTPILNGTRLISHETAYAISKAFPQLKADGLLHAQAKWRLHQLAHPELYTADEQPRRAGARRNPDLDVEEVKRLYLDPEVSMREITTRTQASLATIYAIIDEANIPRRGRRRPNRRAT